MTRLPEKAVCQEGNHAEGGENIAPDTMSLRAICTDCHGKCCVGRTLVTDVERKRIVAYSGADHFVQWDHDYHYIERGPCPYLKNGLCGVQSIKPFVCQIFPLVPRVINGCFWLYCVTECDGGARLPHGFVEKALTLARAFLSDRDPQEYSKYWDENKIGDFDDERVRFRVRVFDEPS